MGPGRTRVVMLLAAGAAALAVVLCGAAVPADILSVDGGPAVESAAGQGDGPVPYRAFAMGIGASASGAGGAAEADASSGLRGALPGEPGESVSVDAPDVQTESGGQFRTYLVASAAFLVIYSLGFWLIQVRRHMPGRGK